MKSSRLTLEVTQEKISAFCHAVGAQSDSVAPPTYFTVCRQGEFELFEALGVPLAHVLHADQEYTYEGDVCAGDVVVFQTTVVSDLEKKNGALRFISFETHFVSGRDQSKLGTGKTTVVIRGN